MDQYPQQPRPDDQPPYPTYPHPGQEQGQAEGQGGPQQGAYQAPAWPYGQQGQPGAYGQQQGAPYGRPGPENPYGQPAHGGQPQQPYGYQQQPPHGQAQGQPPQAQPVHGQEQSPWGPSTYGRTPYGQQPQGQGPAQPHLKEGYGRQQAGFVRSPEAPHESAVRPLGHGGEGDGAGSDGAGTTGGKKRRSRRGIWIAAVTALAVLGGTAVAGRQLDWFNDNGEPVSFGVRTPGDGAGGEDSGGGAEKGGKESGDAAGNGVSMPTGPVSEFKRTSRLDDGTSIVKTRLTGKKSGFTGDVWVWVPKEYEDPRYAKSAFPVLISLPGGNGFPTNYWADRSLGLQKAVTKGVKEGTSLPFILIMPVLNPDEKNYYDGSDIPGQPKMGTWMAEDVPDFTKANFRTFTSRDGWAFMGNSSGAFVGLKMVMQHPDRFKAVIASGGETAPDSPLWRGDRKLMDANDPGKLAQKLSGGSGPEVYVNFQIGTKEGAQDLARLRKFEKDHGKGPVKITTRVIQGGDHNGWDYVRGMEEGSLEWISKVMAKPVPSS
ncbi:alpha/beta hydrolase-fold protein [Streptomyces sp. NPDC097619]|uniref:alpha/beta hydrolase n=1 Tax=Streptomyces sp. NPDC097619 TaxID=3157228 RepID=UPI00332D1EB1